MGTAPIGRMNDWHWMEGPDDTLSWITPGCLKCRHLITNAVRRYKCDTEECPAQHLKLTVKRWLNRHVECFDSRGNYKE